MTPLLRSFWLAVSLLVLSSCGVQEGEMLYLERAEARMPVWVRGNLESGTFLLFLHGGPGSNALMHAGDAFFQDLETRYAVVYWDQRCSGSSQGTFDCTKVTLGDFVEDTDEVVDLLRARYTPSKLVVLGHSWGGLLGPAWLEDPAHQAKVDGWIEVDGAHNVPLGVSLARTWMLERAEAKLAAGEDTGFWTEAKAFYEAHPVIDDASFHQHIGLVHQGGGYYHGPRTPRSLGAILGTPTDVVRKSFHEALLPRVFDFNDLDLTPALAKMTLPSLVLWGRHDGTLPAPLAQHAYDALGTPAEKKRVLIFEHSGHSPFEEEPDAVREAVVDFVETLVPARAVRVL